MHKVTCSVLSPISQSVVLSTRAFRILLPVLLCLALHAALAPGAAAQTPVPHDWALTPAGLEAGDQFRLLVVTNASDLATNPYISPYDQAVQKEIRLGHQAIRSYSPHFRALASSAGTLEFAIPVPPVVARDHTSTTGTGVPIYWLNGAKVADDYTDFYDGTWDSNEARIASGARKTVTLVWTGSNADGTSFSGQELGNAGTIDGREGEDMVRVGSLASTSNTISSGFERSRRRLPVYGLSPVFVVLPGVSITGGAAVTEGNAASFTITASAAPMANLTVNLTVADVAGSDFVAATNEGNKTVIITAGQTTATYTVDTVDDSVNEASGAVTVTVKDGTGYSVGTPSSASVTVNDDDAPELTITGGAGVAEGGTASYTITATVAPAADLTVNLSVADPAGSDFVADDDEGSKTVTLAAGATTASYTVDTVSDTGAAGDEASGPVTVTVETGTGYTVGTPAAAGVRVTDNDVTTVTLEGLAVNLPEGSSLEFSVRLNRALVAGETLPVPVTFGGEASLADYSVSCPSPLPTGVSCAGLATTSATVTFTGPSANLATLTVTSVQDNTGEADPESLVIGLGTLGATSGTGLDGGVTGVDNLADFNLVDAIGVALSFSVEGVSVREGDSDPNTGVARFSAYVASGNVPAGGVVIPFSINSGTAQAGDASSADYGTVPAGISIAAGGLQGTATLSIVDDMVDELRENIRFRVTELPPGYRFHGGAFDTANSVVSILDNDATSVSLNLTGGGTFTEQDTTTSAAIRIRTARRMSNDPLNPLGAETVVVPLTLASTTGAALPGSASPMFAVTASGTGVSINGANTATPTITFTGHATNMVQEATVTFTATGNGDADATAETVTVTMGTPTSTNVDGGVSATMANSATLTIADDDGAPQLAVALVGTDLARVSVSEGETARIRVRRHGGDKSAALSFSATATDADGFSGTFSSVTSIPAGQRSVDITYSVAEDNADVPRGEATYVLNANSAYTLSSMVSVSLEVVDNDATRVSLTAGEGDVVEGDTKGVSVVLNRGLVPGEALVVPLTFGGTATRGTDYTLELSGARGVSAQNLNNANASASVTVTGPESGASARIAVLLLTAETDDVDEPDGETVEIGTGTLNENSGTGLDGGARNVGAESFSILDPVPNAVNLSVSDDGDATEGGDALTITATLDRANATGAAISIPIQADADGTTAQAADYTVASSISIADNAQSGTTSFTATDDDVAESIETVLMELGATLPDGIVSGEADDVGISITDNDTAGLVLSPTSLAVDEGDDASYTVKLATEPTGTVTVAITGHSGTDLTLDTASLEFTTATWDTAQTVTVTAGEDDDTTNDTATLAHAASGGGYDNVGRELAVTVTDNDTVALVLSPTSLGMAEGDDASYTVKLGSVPTGTVTVAITGHSGTDLTLDTESLEFTTSTWDDAQTVTVTAGEDDDTTNDTATLAHAASGGGYDNVEADLPVTVTDNDTAGLVLSPTSLGVDEGDDASYTVKLASLPTGTVTVAITGHSGTDLTLDTASLEFTAATWDTAQTVTVTAGEDDDTTNDTATLAHAASGGGYDNVEADLPVTVTDNDTAGLVLSPTSLAVDEGDDASYTVKLATQPTGTVTVAITGHSGTDLTLDTASLEFTTSTWDDAQTVTVTAGEDDDTTADTATLAHAASGGGYDNVEADLPVTVTDNDTAGLVISPTSLAVDEGDDASYTVKLATQPTGTVTVAITGHSGTDLTLDTASLEFTTSTWDDPQTVTVTAGEDDDLTDDTATLAHAASGGGYSVMATLAVTVTDNDQLPVASFASSSSSVGEDAGTHNVTVGLSPAPTAAITVSYTVGGTATVGSDFSISGSGTLSVASGATTATIPVAITDDTTDESNETVVLTLTTGSDYTVGSTNFHTLTITDDDEAPPPPPPPVNRPPTVSVTCDVCEIPRGGEAGLTATASDPDGDELAYAWSSVSGSFGEVVDSATVNWTAPEEIGPVTILVEVSDGHGGLALAEVTVEVVNRPPTVSVACDVCEVPRGGEVGLTASASDPDGDELAYAWSSVSGSFGEVVDSASAIWTAPEEIGPVTLRVEVSDGHGGLASAEVTVEVVNRLSTVSVACDVCEIPRGGEAGLTASASDPDGDELAYAWSSVSGSFGEVVDSASAIWTAPEEIGPVTIRVEVSDGHGGLASAEVTVEVVNRLSTVSVACDVCEVPRGGEAGLTASASDPDGDELAYAWSSVSGSFGEVVDSASAIWTAPEEIGPVTIRVEVSDGHGGLASAEVTVEVVNRPPTVSVACDVCEVPRGGEVGLTASASDPDGDELAYAWSSVSGSFGEVVDSASVNWTAPEEIGPVTIRVEVSDGHGGLASAEVTVEVVNRLSTVSVACDVCEVPRGGEAGLTASASDPDGDELAYAWSSVSGSFGEVADSASAIWTAPEEIGPVTIRVEVSDGHGGLASAEVTVEVVNRPPTVSVACDVCEIPRGGEVGLTATASDPDGDELAYAWSSVSGSFGEVADSASAIWTAPEEIGPVTIRVEVSDGHGGLASAEVTVEVVNRPPTVSVACDVCEVPRGGEVGLTASASDPDGDELAYAWSSVSGSFGEVADSASAIWTAPEEIGPVTIRVEVSDGHGGLASAEVTVEVVNRPPTVSVACDVCEIPRGGEVGLTATASDPDGDELAYAWSSVSGSFGEVADSASAIWTAPEEIGPVTIRVEVSDGHGGLASAEVTVEVVNRPPTVSVACDVCEIPRGGEVGLTATASDPDGDELAYAWSSVSGSFGEVADSASAIWTAPEEIGPVTLRVEVSDGHGGLASAEVTVEVVNRPPTVSVACDVCEVPRGGEAGLTATASDPDGDELAYAWSSVSGSFGEVAGAASVTWTAPEEIGPVTIRVEVSDGHGGLALAEVTVTVANRPPVFASSEYALDLRENVDGRQRHVDLGAATASDPDGDELTYDLSSGDDLRFTVGELDGMVRYAGPGEDFESEPNRYELTVRARDAYGAQAEVGVVVSVVNVNEVPEAKDDEATTDEDQAITVDVLANDTDPDGDSLLVRSVSAPAHGTTRIASEGGVTYTPEANYHGADRFTYVIADPGGETASAAVEVTVLSVNDAPVAIGAIPGQALDEGGGPVDVDLAPFFEDVDGDALAYRAVSSDRDVATVRVAGALLTLTPVVYGSAIVTVTAEDPEGLTATQTFTVGVDDRLVRAVLGDTLAALARSHLASARMTLGRRMEAGVNQASRLTLMGRTAPLDRTAVSQVAEQVFMDWLSRAALSGSPVHSPDLLGFGAYPASGFGGPVSGEPVAFGRSPVMVGSLYDLGGLSGGSDALLRDTEFELALNSGETRTGWRLSVWGQGDIQAFQGTPMVFGYPAGYDGDVLTGYVGVDAWMTERWLAGVALSRSSGRGNWQVGASRGWLRTTLTALHPYVGWSDGKTSVWAMAGSGWGAIKNVREATGLTGTSDLGLRLGLVEARRKVGAVGGTEFGLRGDAAWAELRTRDGGESVDRLTAAVNQQRLGVDVSWPLLAGKWALQPFGEAHLRRDGGAGQTGTGMEVAFGLRAHRGMVRIDAQARALTMHSAAGYRERGAEMMLTIGEQGREGLSMALSPRWGDGAAGTGALWQDQFHGRNLLGTAQARWALDAYGNYGVRLPSGELLTWFANYSQSHYEHRFLFGARIDGLGNVFLRNPNRHHQSAGGDEPWNTEEPGRP